VAADNKQRGKNNQRKPHIKSSYGYAFSPYKLDRRAGGISRPLPLAFYHSRLSVRRA
jgi:hypothetical protein